MGRIKGAKNKIQCKRTKHKMKVEKKRKEKLNELLEKNEVIGEEVKEKIKEKVEKASFVTQDNEAEVRALIKQIEARKKDFGITTVKLGKIPQQKQLLDDYLNKENAKWTLYYGWNWSGKTFCWAYICSLFALGEDWKRYWLPFIGSKKNIWIVTKSWSNVQSTIDPYLLGDYSLTRIPQAEVESVHRDNKILKSIILKNWCKISIKTYDQEWEGLQWGNPDFIWLDEEPRKWDIWNELFARTRVKWSSMLITMTPLAWRTPIYEFFFENSSSELDKIRKIYKVSSRDNPYTDHSLFTWYSNEEYIRRVEGTFAPPSWLVYTEFRRSIQVVPHFNPEDMGDVDYYIGIDFWTSHPTWVVFIAVDRDSNIYIFDEIYKSNTYLDDIAKSIREKSSRFVVKDIIWDSAWKRERFELGRILGRRITPADKFSKWENDMSNRKASILLVNNLLFNNKLFISENCVNLIKEFEMHFYKENWKKDWEVEKVNDDLLDAMRYVIFLTQNKKKVKTVKEKLYEKKYGEPINNKKLSLL